MNNEVERILKEGVVVWFKVLFQNLPGGLKKTTKSHSQDSRLLGRDLNPVPPK
jgi:hypothetical protein